MLLRTTGGQLGQLSVRKPIQNGVRKKKVLPRLFNALRVIKISCYDICPRYSTKPLIYFNEMIHVVLLRSS